MTVNLELAKKLHETCVVADLHVDTLMAHTMLGYDMTKRHRNRVPRSPLIFQADIPRVKDAGLKIWGLGLVASPLLSPPARLERALRQLRYLHRVCAERPDDIYAIDSAAALREGLLAGKIGALPGAEGAHIIGGDLGRFAELYDNGMRYFTLAHFSGNEAAQCAMGLGSRSGRHKALSDFGRRLVDEIHKRGVILDLAHVNKPGFMEACARSEKPVIVSHTGVSGVNKHWRNIDDEQVEAVAKTGGVVGIIFSPEFTAGRFFAPLQKVADHILHVVKIAGADHAAYGSDLDGWLWTLPKDFSDIADLPKLTELLLDSGLGVEDVKKIIGGNVQRVVESVL